MKTKEKILTCTLELAAEKGLGNVSLAMIAEKVGVRKATLFSHFKSKNDIIESLYEYLRVQSQKNSQTPFDYDTFFCGKTARQALTEVANNYIDMNNQKDFSNFYKFIYSQMAINPAAAMIMLKETETMLSYTKKLFTAMESKGLLVLGEKDIEFAGTLFCLTFHELMNIALYKRLNGIDDGDAEIRKFIIDFCDMYT